jgi:hypothetical protein
MPARWSTRWRPSACSRKVDCGFSPSRNSLRRAKQGRATSCASLMFPLANCNIITLAWRRWDGCVVINVSAQGWHSRHWRCRSCCRSGMCIWVARRALRQRWWRLPHSIKRLRKARGKARLKIPRKVPSVMTIIAQSAPRSILPRRLLSRCRRNFRCQSVLSASRRLTATSSASSRRAASLSDRAHRPPLEARSMLIFGVAGR